MEALTGVWTVCIVMAIVGKVRWRSAAVTGLSVSLGYALGSGVIWIIEHLEWVS